MADKKLRLLFIVNPGSGSDETDFTALIRDYAKGKPYDLEVFELPDKCSKTQVQAAIDASTADRVVAVGGDGTLKLVAECLQGTSVPIGIIPAGSANGMAKELGIPTTFNEAMERVIQGEPKEIHAVKINGSLCIHLSDIGFNAYIVKKFDDLPQRGMWGYAKAAWQALWNHHKMDVEIQIKDQQIKAQAAMVVIANATMYGTGVKINPDGDLSDELFEVILVKEYSVMEILKIRFTDLPFNKDKIEVFQAQNLTIKTKHKVHFQIDGEYMGKLNKVDAVIIPAAIRIIV